MKRHNPTTSPPHNLTRKNLSSLALTPLHASRNWSKAQVAIGEWPSGSGQRVVVKDLSGCPLWFRWLGGRHALAREWRALQKLRDLPEVPNPVARLDADAIVMEARSGRTVSGIPFGALPAAVIEELTEFVAAIHSHGVTHCDMHLENILLDDNGVVSVIDWATSSLFDVTPRGAKAATFAAWKSLDQRALLKLRLLHAPGTLTSEERDILRQGPSGTYRFVKRLRFWFAKLRGKNPDGEFMFTSPQMVALLKASEEIGDKHK